MIPLILNSWESAPPLLGYITSRAVFGFLTAFFVGLLIGRPIILWLYRNGYRSPERSYGDISTASKKSTPVMGGLIIAACGLGSVLIWADVGNPRVMMVVAAALWFALMGALDDVGKVRGMDSDAGISRLAKYASQIGFGALLGGLVLWQGTRLFGPGEVLHIYVPFMKTPLLDLGQIFGTTGIGVRCQCCLRWICGLCHHLYNQRRELHGRFGRLIDCPCGPDAGGLGNFRLFARQRELRRVSLIRVPAGLGRAGRGLCDDGGRVIGVSLVQRASR